MVSESQEALFERHGNHFLPSEFTRGGWSDDAQHGGPPAGLLARAIENHRVDAPMALVRLTVDLVRPVPLAPITVSSSFIRSGRRVQLLEATLEADGLEVARATGLRIRTTELDLPELPEIDWRQPPGPDAGVDPDLGKWAVPKTDKVRFHAHAIEIRSIEGSFERAGPGTAWFRLLRPLVAGEAPTMVQRIATISDMGNATSQMMSPTEYLWINPDITLYLHRPSAGEWIGLKSVAFPRREGLGVSDSLVFDRDGPLGRIVQAQLVDRHAG